MQEKPLKRLVQFPSIRQIDVANNAVLAIASAARLMRNAQMDYISGDILRESLASSLPTQSPQPEGRWESHLAHFCHAYSV